MFPEDRRLGISSGDCGTKFTTFFFFDARGLLGAEGGFVSLYEQRVSKHKYSAVNGKGNVRGVDSSLRSVSSGGLLACVRRNGLPDMLLKLTDTAPQHR